MKTAVVTLQGQDFVVMASAEPVLLAHLKQLQRATRWHPAAYHQNVEALRDVLLTEGGKTVSKAKLVQAIQLVGVPNGKPWAKVLCRGFRGSQMQPTLYGDSSNLTTGRYMHGGIRSGFS